MAEGLQPPEQGRIVERADTLLSLIKDAWVPICQLIGDRVEDEGQPRQALGTLDELDDTLTLAIAEQQEILSQLRLIAERV